MASTCSCEATSPAGSAPAGSGTPLFVVATRNAIFLSREPLPRWRRPTKRAAPVAVLAGGFPAIAGSFAAMWLGSDAALAGIFGTVGAMFLGGAYELARWSTAVAARTLPNSIQIDVAPYPAQVSSKVGVLRAAGLLVTTAGVNVGPVANEVVQVLTATKAIRAAYAEFGNGRVPDDVRDRVAAIDEHLSDAVAAVERHLQPTETARARAYDHLGTIPAPAPRERAPGEAAEWPVVP